MHESDYGSPEETETISYGGTGEIIQTREPTIPTPTGVYEGTVSAADKLWIALTTTSTYKSKKLIPSQTSDPLLDFIKSSRKIWLRTLKGLTVEQSSQMCLVWLDMLIQDRLQQVSGC